MVNWAAPSAVNPGLLDDTLLMTLTSVLPWSISSHAFLPTATATVGSWYVMPALLSAAKKLASGPELPGSACAGVTTPSTAAKPASMTRNRMASSSSRLAPLSRPIFNANESLLVGADYASCRWARLAMAGDQGQIDRRRARCLSTEGRPRPRNQRSLARRAATVVVMAGPSGIGISRRRKRTLNYE